ncbi:LuxR C-terminal-related transcriptional regulator [Aneurinibacillus thermoaerophilus]|uniref:response regulator transcription factor n=1 Tax=Aneurinibacillus thermoaerophilus TaxID=143495 RepID=UPI002E244282|nr:LuxR C-terminal-related transcriptional regulator [Aneurinibacillus thermoaerophilus]MED0674369.1 LuxR C-terminal-related transcriptional regulator [Aneurinibacillus thermoaerophilus]
MLNVCCLKSEEDILHRALDKTCKFLTAIEIDSKINIVNEIPSENTHELYLFSVQAATLFKQREISHTGVQKSIIFYTEDQEATIFELISLGFRFYLPVNFTEAQFIRTLTALLELDDYIWQNFYSPCFLQAKDVYQVYNTEISTREKEVLIHILDGLNTPKIAEKLKISSRTVEFHCKNLLEKFHVGSRLELVKLIVGSGLLCDEKQMFFCMLQNKSCDHILN